MMFLLSQMLRTVDTLSLSPIFLNSDGVSQRFKMKQPWLRTSSGHEMFHAWHMASILVLHVYMQAVGTLKSFIQCQAPTVQASPTTLTHLLPPRVNKHKTFSVLLPIPQHLTHIHTHPASTPTSWPALHMKIYNPFLHHKHNGERKASSGSTNKERFCEL